MVQPLSQQIIGKHHVESRSTPDAGNGLFATHAISIREVILQVSRPLTLALDTPRLKDTCYQCLRPHETTSDNFPGFYVKELKACKGCDVVKYCDKICQTTSWKLYHKHECKIFNKLRPRVLPNSVRAVIRLLLIRDKLPLGEWDQLMSLEAHIPKLRKAQGERWQNLCLMTKAAKEYSGSKLDEHTILGIFGRLMVNSFTLVTQTFDPIGLTLHPFPALINHSCSFNSVVRKPSGNSDIQVVPLRDIKKSEQITVSYVDATLPYFNRQAELNDRYFFKCQCSKCLQGPTTIFDSWIDQSLPPDIDMLRGIEEQALSLKTAAEDDTSLTGPVQKLKYAIHLLQKTQVWPLHRYPCPDLRHQLILAYLTAKQYTHAFAHAAIRHFKVDPITFQATPSHPSSIVHDFLFVQILGHVKEEADWASQTLDLAKYKIDFHYWQKCIIRDLKRDVALLPPSGLTRLVCTRHEEIRGSFWYQANVADALLDDQVVKAQRREPVDRLMDHVLASERVWDAAT